MENISPARTWHELTTDNDIAELMDLFGHFHDGCVREVHVATGHFVGENLSMSVGWRTTVHMLVQRQIRQFSAIELRFEEVVALKLSPPTPNYESIIFRAAFLFLNGVFYWAESDDWSPDSPEPNDLTWIAARRAWWRDASEWMGPTLRYRTERP